MILAVDEVMKLPEFATQNEKVIEEKLNAAELMIRAYTNNNFQNRFVRFTADSLGNRLLGTSDFLKVGDTVQISQSMVNDGLYKITELGDDFIRVDQELYKSTNLITKVEYPADVRAGVLELLKWDIKNRPKTGVKSETLSRYSVILSRLVDTFFSRISPTMQLPPKHHSIAYVLPWAEGLHWQSRSSGCSNS